MVDAPVPCLLTVLVNTQIVAACYASRETVVVLRFFGTSKLQKQAIIGRGGYGCRGGRGARAKDIDWGAGIYTADAGDGAGKHVAKSGCV